MDQNLNTMTQIMTQKEIDIASEERLTLDSEGRVLAEHKQFTIDQLEEISLDPLR